MFSNSLSEPIQKFVIKKAVEDLTFLEQLLNENFTPTDAACIAVFALNVNAKNYQKVLEKIEEAFSKKKDMDRNAYYTAVRDMLGQDNLDAVFIKHRNAEWSTIDVLIGYGVSSSSLATAIERCKDVDLEGYIERFLKYQKPDALESKLESDQFNRVIGRVNQKYSYYAAVILRKTQQEREELLQQKDKYDLSTLNFLYDAFEGNDATLQDFLKEDL